MGKIITYKNFRFKRRHLFILSGSIAMLAFFFYQCSKEKFEIQNLNNNQIYVFGHGGMGVDEPYAQNSYESIAKCLQLGADGCEIDIQLSKDHVLIAYHDEDLSTKTNKSGPIHQYNWPEISDALYDNTPYTRYHLRKLEDIFQNLPDIQRYIITLDCKLYQKENRKQYIQAYTAQIVQIVRKHNLQDNIFIESNDTSFLRALQNSYPEFALFIYPSNFENGLSIAKKMHLYGITMATDKISANKIQMAHQLGIHIAIWNIHNPIQTKEAINKNPDFIKVDNMRYTLRILK